METVYILPHQLHPLDNSAARVARKTHARLPNHPTHTPNNPDSPTCASVLSAAALMNGGVLLPRTICRAHREYTLRPTDTAFYTSFHTLRTHSAPCVLPTQPLPFLGTRNTDWECTDAEMQGYIEAQLARRIDTMPCSPLRRIPSGQVHAWHVQIFDPKLGIKTAAVRDLSDLFRKSLAQ